MQQAEHLAARVRTLHGNHGEVRTLLHFHVERTRVLFDPRQILHPGRRVHHQAKMRLGKKVHDEIVNHTGVLVEHARVQRLARHLQLVHAVGEQMTQKLARARPVQIDHRHVRHVKHARIAAHGMMLFNLRAVMHRHVPAAEVHHVGAQCTMGGVEYGLGSHRCTPRRKPDYRGARATSQAPRRAALRHTNEAAPLGLGISQAIVTRNAQRAATSARQVAANGHGGQCPPYGCE